MNLQGADIANICNEAAIVAARRAADSVTMDDFEKAIDRVIGGLESHRIMSKEERAIVAHHVASVHQGSIPLLVSARVSSVQLVHTILYLPQAVALRVYYVV